MPTDEALSILKKLKPNKPFLLSETELTPSERQRLYHLSRRERMKVSLKTLAGQTWITKLS